MANCQKYTSTATGNMVIHYDRGQVLDHATGEMRFAKFQNQNIDTSRSHLNYHLSQKVDVQKVISEAKKEHKKLAGRAVKSNANVMASWVVTLPEDVEQKDEDKFFAKVHDFLAHRYGQENILRSVVHVDETTPHLHFAFMPIRDGKFNAAQVINRSELQRFHGELSRHVEKEIGYKVSIELDAQDPKKIFSNVDLKKVEAAHEHVAELRKEEEALRGSVSDLKREKVVLLEEMANLRSEVDEIKQEKAKAVEFISRILVDAMEVINVLSLDIKPKEIGAKVLELGTDIANDVHRVGQKILGFDVPKAKAAVDPAAKKSIRSFEDRVASAKAAAAAKSQRPSERSSERDFSR